MKKYYFSGVTGGLLLMSSLADATVTDEVWSEKQCGRWEYSSKKGCKGVVNIDTTAKVEFFEIKNRKLRTGEKRINKLEIEPLLRLSADVMKDNPIYGRVEVEWKKVIKRESAEQPDKKTKLELNQAYVGLRDNIIPATDLRLGRWLYRDEREWLFDENLDGGWARWGVDEWSVDALGGRLNYWTKDLMSHNDSGAASVDVVGVIVRRNITDDWVLGAYGTWVNHRNDERSRQNHYGVRSHNSDDSRFRHWLELGVAERRKSGEQVHGYAVDVGGTYIWDADNINPRLTLGYAMGSKNYYQTGLHSNEATLGGGTKFQIYGETLNPELTNMHIFTVGVGADIGKNTTLDLLYHDYYQVRRGELSSDSMDLRPKYDQQNRRRLGAGVDLIYGWEPVSWMKFELKLGMFTPSSRFTSGAKASSERSQPAYSIASEVSVSF